MIREINEDAESIRSGNSHVAGEIVESQREELHCAQAEELQQREQQLLQGQLLQQHLELREAHQRSLIEMEELWKFQSSALDTMARRKFVEDRNTFLELSGRIQDLQNEVNCMNDSKEFQDAESVRSGHSHFTSRLVSFPPHPIPGGMLSRSVGMPSRRKGPPCISDTQGISGNVFGNPTASSSAPYSLESNPWSSDVSEHTSPHVMSESQTPVHDQRCQSGPSVRNSVIPSEGGFSKDHGPDQQGLQISDLHFDKYTTPATFGCWKNIQDRGMYLFTISYGSNAVDQRSGDG